MNTLKLTSAFVHVIYLLVLSNQNGAAFARTLQRNEAVRSGETKHINGYIHEGQEEDDNAKGRSDDSVKNNSHSRRERSVTGDSGYGSRLDAATHVANDNLQRSFFNRFGKRAMDGSDGCLPSEQRLLAEYGFRSRLPERMVKRGMDSGYGSRTRVADNLAKSNGVLYGLYGPGKRAKNYFNLDDDELVGLKFQMSGVEDDGGYGSRLFGLKFQTSGVEADGGYGSRVTAGEQVAIDHETIEDIYGENGPGK